VSVFIGSSVTSIGGSAFNYVTSLSSVTFETGSQLTSIGQYAFSGASSLTSITIPASVASIGNKAFMSSSSLTSITVDQSNTNFKSIDGVLFDFSGARLIQYPLGSSASNYEIPATVNSVMGAFLGASSLSSVTFEAGSQLAIIGIEAFREASSLTSITIPESVTSIGRSAFSRASSLTSIIIPASVTSIGASAFDTTALTSIIIPANVNSIGYDAFREASSLSSVSFEENSQLASIEHDVFRNTSLSSITIPASVGSIGNFAFKDASSLASVTFEEGSQLTSIGTNVFADSGVTSITIPASVESIGSKAFNGATSLSSVTFEENSQLASIEINVFRDTALTSIIIPANVTSIGSYAFLDSRLTTVYIADGQLGIKSPDTGVSFYGATVNTIPIGASIFTYSDGSTSASPDTTITSSSYGGNVPVGASLVSVFISSSVTSIGSYAFNYKSSLTSVTFAEGSQLTSIGEFAFNGASSLTSFTIPANVTSIGNYVFASSSSLSSITVDQSNTNFKTIDGVLFDFSGARLIQYPLGSSASNYEIPATVNSVMGAFYGASSLTSVTFEAGSQIAIIGDSAFRDASSLSSITIPESVTSIGYSAFANASSLSSVIFETGSQLTIIGGNAFNGATSLTSITIPEGVTNIGERAFIDAALTSITIPASVVSIGDDAFNGASSLSSVTFEAGSQLASIGESAFQDTSSLTSITIPASVGSIGYRAFYDATSLTSVIFDPSSNLTSIGSNAFRNTGFTSITIPANVNSIGSKAFTDSSLYTVYIENGQVISSISITSPSTGTVNFFGATNVNIELSATPPSVFTFSDGSTFERTATTIISNSYGGNVPVGASLVSVFISSSVTSIGSYAFNYKSSLTSVTFEAGSQLTSIGEFAFSGASSLTSITIPANVTSIGNYVFTSSSSLSSITVDQSNTNFKTIDGVLFDFSGARLIQYPLGSSASNYEIPATVNSVMGAFYGASSLTSVTFEAGSQIAIIGDSAFRDASSLSSITIPESVTSIGYSAFANASSLSSVTFEEISQLTIIGGNAFNGATSLTSITIPEGVTNIGEGAFIDAALTSITIPAGVTNIGYDAFYNASSLSSVTFEPGSQLASIGESAFSATSSLTSITIPASVTSIGARAFYGASSLTSVTFEAGSQLTSIGHAAFFNSALTSITIPANVASIAYGAFTGTSLSTVYIENGQVISSISITSPSTGTVNFFGATVSIQLPGGNEPVVLEQTVIDGIEGAVPTSVDVNESEIGISVPQGLLTTGSVQEKSQKRRVFLEKLFTANAGLAGSSGKITIPKEELLGAVTIIRKSTMVVKKATNSDVAYDPSELGEDEGVYVFMEVGDFTVINTSDGKLKIVKDTESQYSIYENYIGNASLVTKTMSVGQTSKLGTFEYVLGSVGGQISAESSVVPICFPGGTPVMTNKGEVAIEKLNPDIHKIRGKKIVGITESCPLFKYIIRIEENALGKNVPNRRTEISKDHEVFYKGKMIRSEELVEKCEGVYRIKYNGEILYNVLMESHEKMMINNLICETLDPSNIMAKLYRGKYSSSEKNKIISELNKALKKNDLEGCKRIYKSLK
jgi:hypothetical protein